MPTHNNCCCINAGLLSKYLLVNTQCLNDIWSANSVELVFVPPVSAASSPASVRSPVVSPSLQQPLVVPDTVNHSRLQVRAETQVKTSDLNMSYRRTNRVFMETWLLYDIRRIKKLRVVSIVLISDPEQWLPGSPAVMWGLTGPGPHHILLYPTLVGPPDYPEGAGLPPVRPPGVQYSPY